MRIFVTTCLLVLAAHSAQAEAYQVQMPVELVEIFAGFAKATRKAELDLPAGEHRIFVPLAGLSDVTQGISLRSSPGAMITSINAVTPREFDAQAVYTPEQTEAFAAVEAAQDRIAEKMRELEAAKARIAALVAQRAFLGSVTGTDKQMLDPEAMMQVSRAIRDESETAGLAEIDVQEAMVGLREDLEDLQRALALAEQRFESLNPPESPDGGLSISVTVNTPGVTAFELADIGAWARWQFLYDVRLTEGDAPRLTISRKALIVQELGETWNDVALTLSTASIDQTDPSFVRGDRARIFEPEKGVVGLLSAGSEMRAAPAPMVEEAVYLDAAPATMAVVDGAVLAYASPGLVTVESGGDGLILELDRLEMAPDLSLEASPRFDATAFVVAEITNDTGEHIIPGAAVLYRGEQVVGETEVELIRTGESRKIAFGPEQGIVVSHDVLRRETGDRGLVSVSNTREEQVEFTLQNLTEEARTVRATYALPYSEQEDLQIVTRVVPQPDEMDIENRRGVSAWVVELAPGETKKVVMQHRLTWPEGQELRWNP